MIKTVTLSGEELKVDDLGGFNTIVHNLSDSEVYASKYPNIKAGADNVAEIPAGAAKLISTTNGTVYLIGTGKAELTGQDHDSVNFSQPSSVKHGDGTGDLIKEYVDNQDSVNLGAAKEYADTQINAVEKGISNLQINKADKSELPTTLPANGGNANTVNGHTVKSDVPADAKFTDTTYSAMTGATETAAGKSGLVPTPAAGKQLSYFRGDGKWENPLKPKNVTVENTDLNDYTASGIYYFSGNYTPAKNLPLSTITNGWLVVIEAFTSGGIKQFWIRYGTPNSNDHQTFVRTRVNSTWGNWKRFATEDEIPSYSAATQSKTGLMTAADKTKLDGIAENANKYTHPTKAGNKHIPAGGKSGQILRWSADGTAVWGADNDTTYSAMTGATETSAGKSGLVPAPPKNSHLHNYLKANGQFANPLNPISITTDGTNLNDYKTSGIYYFGSEHTPSNTPGELVNGWLIVIRYSENTIKQIILRGGTANSNDFNTYVRTFLQGNTWSDWKKFVTVPPTVNPRLIVNIVQGELGDNGGTNNVSYQAGATRALVFGWKNGVINSSNNQAFGSILLTGLSASMTAKSGTSICVGASTTLSASVNSTGTISLSGSGGQKYMVVWLS